MKRFFLLAFVLVVFGTGSVLAEYKHTSPWAGVELSAFDLIQDGYRLISAEWPGPNIEVMYFQKKDRVYRCWTDYKLAVNHGCEELSKPSDKNLAKKVLKMLATAQENYYAKNDTYTSDLEALWLLEGFELPPKVDLKITHADKLSWRGVAFHRNNPKKKFTYDSAELGLQD